MKFFFFEGEKVLQSLRLREQQGAALTQQQMAGINPMSGG